MLQKTPSLCPNQCVFRSTRQGRPPGHPRDEFPTERLLLRIIMHLVRHLGIHNKNKPAAEKTMRPIIEASIMGFSAAAVASLLEGRIESTLVDSGVNHSAGTTVSHGPSWMRGKPTLEYSPSGLSNPVITAGEVCEEPCCCAPSATGIVMAAATRSAGRMVKADVSLP